MKNYIDQAWEIYQKNRKITPEFISKTLNINIKLATKVCQTVWLRSHIEARQMTKALECLV